MYLLNFNNLINYKKLIIYLILSIKIISSTKILCNNNFNFYFQDKKLSELINEISKEKKINIILPQLKNQLDELNKITITYMPKNEKFININKAWETLKMFLSLSGYNFIQKDENIYEIVLNNIEREPLKIYYNVKPKELPNSREVIRYIAYLKNIQVSDQTNVNNLNQIFKDMLSPKGQAPIYLKDLNGYMISDRADIIASIQTIINKLDKRGFQETIEVIKLNYLPASDLVKTLKTLQIAIKPKAESPAFIARNDTIDQIKHFASDLKILTDPQHNALIIMGRNKAVSAIRHFITKYIDQPNDSGKSILHYYNLQYLDAKEFEPIIQKVVSPNISAKQGSEEKLEYGPFRKFKGVVIKAEQTIEVNPIDNPFDTQIKSSNQKSNITFTGLSGVLLSGGNRLLILALQDDWKHIKRLIKKLDQPRPQVLIDALIMDLNISNIKQLESTTRSLTETSFLPSANTQFISSNITPMQNVLGKNPKEIAQDLLALAIPNSVPKVVPPKSLLITFNDSKTPGIASIIEVLDQYSKVNIRTHPFLCILNNEKGAISQVIKKRNRADSSPGKSGSFIIGIENIDATIKLSCIPHVVDENQLRLDIGIRIETFLGDTLNKTTQAIYTTCNLTNDQALAIGGFKETLINNELTKTPILGSIPIIGNLFKGEKSNVIKTNIIILIKPTIIMPRIKLKKLEISSTYVQEKLNKIKTDMTSDLAYNFTDPIIKFFIPNKDFIKNTDLLAEYLEETRQVNLIKNKKRKNRKNIKQSQGLNFDKIKQNLKQEYNLDLKPI